MNNRRCNLRKNSGQSHNSKGIEYELQLDIQLLRSWELALGLSVDFIYGYSYLIPSEFWIGYFLHHAYFTSL